MNQASIQSQQALCATKLQSHIRRFLTRRRVISIILQRTEKIWDPRRQDFYYYDSNSNISSWTKPRLLRNIEIDEIAPTYKPDEAAILIVRQCLRRAALRRVRMLYKDLVVATYDETYKATYYYNEKTNSTTWELPGFMNGTLEYAYDKLPPGGKIAGQEQSSSESEDSDLSIDSELARQRRRAKRRFPRSKVQKMVDFVEDHIKIGVEKLSLQHCNISHRLTDRIWDLTSLQILNISHNSVERISSKIQYLIKLQDLDVSFNKLSSLPKKIEDLTLLKTFIACNNNFSSFTGFLFKCQKLETIDFSFNQFEKLPIVEGNLELLKATKQWEVGIGVLKNLKYLNLKGNKLTSWPEQLDKNTKLVELNISENFLSIVPSIIDKNSALSVLDLSNNLLHTLPTEIYYLPLRKLVLNNNCLEDLPVFLLPKATDGSITNHGKSGLSGIKMSTIAEVDISFNKISKLDFRIGLFEKVRRFIANDNCITEIHENIGLLKTVKELNLARNKLQGSSIAGIGYCEALSSLNLSCNMIEFIPDSFATLRSLSDFNAGDNLIAQVPDRLFTSFLNMQRLDLHNNKIESIPMSLYAMRKIVYLNLSFNCISQAIPKQIEQFTQLETLFLNRNRISELPNSFSSLGLLQVLEIDNNMLTRFPLSISKLKRLRRVTTQLNDIEIRPHGLLEIPTLISWDMGWNRNMVLNAIDWTNKFAKYRKEVDLMSSAFLRKLLNKAKLAIGLCDERKNIATIHVKEEVAPDETDSIADSSSSAKKKSKKSKKAVEEQKRIEDEKRITTQNKIREKFSYALKWHSRLMEHFEQHLSPFAGSVYERFRKSTESNLIAKVETSLRSFEQKTHSETARRTNIQYLSMMRDIYLSSSVNRNPITFFERFHSEAPQLDLLASLDLGYRFQEGIELYEMLAHEIFVNASLAHNAKKKLAVQQAKIKRDSLLFMSNNDPNPKSSETTTDGVPVRDSSTSNSIQVGLLELALGDSRPMDTARSDHFSLRSAVAAQENSHLENPTIHDIPVTFDEVSLEYECSQKNLITDFAVPSILHDPLLGKSTDLFKIALECYFGLGVAILHRVDKISLAIRNLELRGNLKFSVLDIAQRQGRDLKDMVAEVFDETVELMKKKEENASGSFLERKKKKMAAFMNASGANDVQVQDDVPEEEQEAEQKGKTGTGNKKKKQKDVKVLAVEDDSEAEKLMRKQLADAAIEEHYIGEPITSNDAIICVKFLFDHRKLLSIWALKALDAAAELLKLLGWDTTHLSPGPEAKREQEAFVENGSECMRLQAMDIHLYRAQALQRLALYDKCLLEYQSLVALRRGKFHRNAELEIIKVTLAQSNFIAGKELLHAYIERDVEHADVKFPEPFELLKSHYPLALLLMFANSGCEQLKYMGYKRSEHTLSFEVVEAGMFQKPKPIKESEVWKTRNFELDILHMRTERNDLRIAEVVAKTENVVLAMKSLLSDAKGKFHAQLNDSRADLVFYNTLTADNEDSASLEVEA